MTRIIISSHRLAIERGTVTPVEDKNCKICNSQDIENDTHLMLSCEYYKGLRDQLFIKLNSKCHNFAVMTDANKLIYKMCLGINIC